MSKAQTRAGNTPPPAPAVDHTKNFKDGKELRDGTHADAAYTTVVATENVDENVTTEARSAALFDEQGLDPYEVNNAQ